MVPMPEDSYCRDGKMETVSQNKLWASNETKPLKASVASCSVLRK